MTDLDERAWFVFAMPGVVAWVPAETEEAARAVLGRNCYRGAPVADWPCVHSRWTSREMLARELLRKVA